jgi:hypothetical protein
MGKGQDNKRRLKREIPETKTEKMILGSIPYVKVIFLLFAIGVILDNALGQTWNGIVSGILRELAVWTHEIGHFTTKMFGNFFMEVVSGTLFQVGIPLGLAGYLLIKRKLYAASFMIIWVGYNLFSVSNYMNSGVSIVGTQMKSVIPGPGMHDWRVIFNVLGVFTKAEFISSIVYYAAFAFIIIGGIVGLYGAFQVKYDKLD